mmetsp:Transcript_3939/g.8546  ORF Transcript_3939/g.8546 Transcript_3939/m.8546 type:complete len:257 (-) Transcript_3939:94-864(-)
MRFISACDVNRRRSANPEAGSAYIEGLCDGDAGCGHRRRCTRARLQLPLHRASRGLFPLHLRPAPLRRGCDRIACHGEVHGCGGFHHRLVRLVLLLLVLWQHELPYRQQNLGRGSLCHACGKSLEGREEFWPRPCGWPRLPHEGERILGRRDEVTTILEKVCAHHRRAAADAGGAVHKHATLVEGLRDKVGSGIKPSGYPGARIVVDAHVQVIKLGWEARLTAAAHDRQDRACSQLLSVGCEGLARQVEVLACDDA